MADLLKVDHSALRTNQAIIIVLNLLAFIFDLPMAAFFVGLVMLTGSLLKRPGFGFVYTLVLKPSGQVKPDVLDDNPEPHRFAQTFGSIVLLVGTLILYIGPAAVGWGMVWLVVALAALNLFGGFCVGCAMYYWLNRLRVPGFSKSPPPGSTPGMRPKMEQS